MPVLPNTMSAPAAARTRLTSNCLTAAEAERLIDRAQQLTVIARLPEETDGTRHQGPVAAPVEDVGKLFLVACVLDVVYQLLVLRWVYPVQTVIVATVLAIFPYLVFRGLANRLGRRIGSKKSEKEGER